MSATEYEIATIVLLLFSPLDKYRSLNMKLWMLKCQIQTSYYASISLLVLGDESHNFDTPQSTQFVPQEAQFFSSSSLKASSC